jgi:predicted TPR repeat methyltransferase
VENGQTDLAIAAYQRVLQLDPDNQEAQEKLGQLKKPPRPGSP